MMGKDQVVKYYCRWCDKDVECWLSVWVMAVTLSTPHKAKVEVSAKCPRCGSRLGNGVAFIDLY